MPPIKIMTILNLEIRR